MKINKENLNKTTDQILDLVLQLLKILGDRRKELTEQEIRLLIEATELL